MIIKEGTITVNKYKIIALIISEKRPNVTMLSGKKSIFKIGRTIKFIPVKTAAPRRRV